VVAKPVQDRPRRFGEAVGCADCPAVLAPLAWRVTRYARFARCARTDAPSLVCMRAARAARVAGLAGRVGPGGPTVRKAQTAPRTVCVHAHLLGASQEHRVLPCTVFAAALAVFRDRQPALRPRAGRHLAGAISAATRSAAPGSARVSALRELTRRCCLNVAPAGREVSYRRDPGASTAVQSKRKRRPPQHEPLAGADRRDTLTAATRQPPTNNRYAPQRGIRSVQHDDCMPAT
jgi:hypothetical protein